MSADAPLVAPRTVTSDHVAPEEKLALVLMSAVSDSLESRGLADAKVELVHTRATALAGQLRQLIDDPNDRAPVDRAMISVELLASNLAALVGESPRLS